MTLSLEAMPASIAYDIDVRGVSRERPGSLTGTPAADPVRTFRIPTVIRWDKLVCLEVIAASAASR
jgi:hypothetical protein